MAKMGVDMNEFENQNENINNNDEENREIDPRESENEAIVEDNAAAQEACEEVTEPVDESTEAEMPEEASDDEALTEKLEPRFKTSQLIVGAYAATGEEAVESEQGEVVFLPKSSKKSAIATFYEYLETFCYALALMMVLFLFVFRYVTVDGPSMRETLQHEDKLIISNLFYTPKTGDIIVINPESHGVNEQPIIKRVIATEGQTVRIDYQNWEVYVDGVKLDEPYIEAMRTNSSMNQSTNGYKYVQEVTVGEGKVFVMGDNRNNSSDSRDARYGEMGVNRILGRVIIRLSPNFGRVK